MDRKRTFVINWLKPRYIDKVPHERAWNDIVNSSFVFGRLKTNVLAS